MNRAPSHLDPWWNDHKTSCGGNYHKIKEPEGYKSKKPKSSEIKPGIDLLKSFFCKIQAVFIKATTISVFKFQIF